MQLGTSHAGKASETGCNHVAHGHNRDNVDKDVFGDSSQANGSVLSCPTCSSAQWIDFCCLHSPNQGPVSPRNVVVITALVGAAVGAAGMMADALRNGLGCLEQ